MLSNQSRASDEANYIPKGAIAGGFTTSLNQPTPGEGLVLDVTRLNADTAQSLGVLIDVLQTLQGRVFGEPVENQASGASGRPMPAGVAGILRESASGLNHMAKAALDLANVINARI